MGACEHYRYCISTELVTKADSQGLEKACLQVRLSAPDSPYFGAKTPLEELCIHLSASSLTLFCLLFLLLLTKQITCRKTLLSLFLCILRVYLLSDLHPGKLPSS